MELKITSQKDRKSIKTQIGIVPYCSSRTTQNNISTIFIRMTKMRKIFSYYGDILEQLELSYIVSV